MSRELRPFLIQCRSKLTGFSFFSNNFSPLSPIAVILSKKESYFFSDQKSYKLQEGKIKIEEGIFLVEGKIKWK